MQTQKSKANNPDLIETKFIKNVVVHRGDVFDGRESERRLDTLYKEDLTTPRKKTKNVIVQQSQNKYQVFFIPNNAFFKKLNVFEQYQDIKQMNKLF